ncbi:MAG: hypothetical protein GXY74_08505 [Phycisphaerae bacterium]|nr:hypothetical protein [Phycisphaerae bacterium]
MKASLARAANHVGRLHAAALEERSTYVSVYPVIDGFYAVSDESRSVRDYVQRVFRRLACHFMKANTVHRCFYRCGVARGKLLLGADLLQGTLAMQYNPRYSAGIAIGEAIVLAYEAETKAAPYGVCTDPSVDAPFQNAANVMANNWWKWWNPNDANHVARIVGLRTEIDAYLAQAVAGSLPVPYSQGRAQQHRGEASQYFQ